MRQLHIIYEDSAIIIVDKPAGMLVIPAPREERYTLTDLLNRELDDRGIQVNAYPCHRLDRETSGLIVYAKGKKIQDLMMDKFRHHQIKKRYIAFAHGRLNRRSGSIDRPVEYKKALTRYRVIEQRRGYAVVEIEPVTGRTNQIRIHFKAIGHPLVGERKFAFARDYELKFRRAALHSWKIEFPHPVTGNDLTFISPLPVDMGKFKAAFS